MICTRQLNARGDKTCWGDQDACVFNVLLRPDGNLKDRPGETVDIPLKELKEKILSVSVFYLQEFLRMNPCLKESGT